VHRSIRAWVLVLFAASVGQLLPPAPTACAQTTATAAQLQIGGEVSTPLALTVADLKKMPRKTVSVVNPKESSSRSS
jgi:DMSO/TMAO reductase YedYZ molybdopterin-dependent catalytic subunit